MPVPWMTSGQLRRIESGYWSLIKPPVASPPFRTRHATRLRFPRLLQLHVGRVAILEVAEGGAGQIRQEPPVSRAVRVVVGPEPHHSKGIKRYDLTNGDVQKVLSECEHLMMR